ncbi:MAG: O-methyltransferase, partial [Cyclobacteriaceae bacterium]
TSLGISTLYLSIKNDVKVTTLEGSQSLKQLAEFAFDNLGRKNIELIIGNIDDTLSPALESMPIVDLAFLDANHRLAPTVAYAEKLWSHLKPGGVLIADDIHRSAEMGKSWKHILKMKGCSASFDLFRWGLVVKEPSNLDGHHIWSIR